MSEFTEALKESLAALYIQTGTADGTGSANTTNISGTSSADRKLAIEINSPSNPSVNTSHTLWQLEQMDILSLAKDLFFQPKWDELLSDEYNQLSIFFKRVFDKKLPNGCSSVPIP
jgi:hypothetical protein